jgi:hypothetical protein
VGGVEVFEFGQDLRLGSFVQAVDPNQGRAPDELGYDNSDTRHVRTYSFDFSSNCYKKAFLRKLVGFTRIVTRARGRGGSAPFHVGASR